MHISYPTNLSLLLQMVLKIGLQARSCAMVMPSFAMTTAAQEACAFQVYIVHVSGTQSVSPASAALEKPWQYRSIWLATRRLYVETPSCLATALQSRSAAVRVYEPAQSGVGKSVVLVDGPGREVVGTGVVTEYSPVAKQRDVRGWKLEARVSSQPKGLLSWSERLPSQQSEQLSLAPKEGSSDQARMGVAEVASHGILTTRDVIGVDIALYNVGCWDS